MWKKIECVAIYSEDIDQSIEFYTALGLIKAWDTFQDSEQRFRIVGMSFPEGDSQLVLKSNPDLKFIETEIMVEDLCTLYEKLKEVNGVNWIRPPFSNPLGGHVAVMEAPDRNVFVLVGK